MARDFLNNGLMKKQSSLNAINQGGIERCQPISIDAKVVEMNLK